MKGYAAQGFSEFVVALGYKGEIIKDFFINYHQHTRSLTVELGTGSVVPHESDRDDWTVHLLDTGPATLTGGRVKQLLEFIGDRTCMLTYGDGVSDVDFERLLAFHRSHGKAATVTAVRPPARFGNVIFDRDGVVSEFAEKPQVGEGWVNGGFFILEPSVRDYLPPEDTDWEREPLERLAADRQLVAYRHEGFWQSMDTLRDQRYLDQLWQSQQAGWRTW
jgi:glucose-1-phosphate cytidylyltransferase